MYLEMSIVFAWGLLDMPELSCRSMFIAYNPLTSKLAQFDFRPLLQIAARWRNWQLIMCMYYCCVQPFHTRQIINDFIR